MGGICGHAGVFSTARDVGQFLLYMLVQARGGGGEAGSTHTFPKFLNATTVTLFTTLHNSSQSSRALGWSINTPEAKDFGYDNSCGTMSTLTFMHTGYTGTCVCVDPSSPPMWSVILTNR
jgi:CubicO group peptidase (beta-lactamase class C family)